MLVIELFAGSGVMSEAFEALGYETFKVDIQQNEKGTIDLIGDVNDLTPADFPSEPYVIWASPPCTQYSLARAQYKAFYPGGKPMTQAAHDANSLVLHTLDLVEQLNPTYWFIENPRAHLRQQPFMKQLMRTTIRYCQYGEKFEKPTDIWGRFPITWRPRGRCHHSIHTVGVRDIGRDPTRGKRPIGFEVIPKSQRAILPLELCEQVAQSCHESKGAYQVESLRAWL